MAEEFFKTLDIPYFDDDFMDDLNSSIGYRVDRRFFDNDLLDGTKEILPSGPSFSSIWEFVNSCQVITYPSDFLCIKPNHRTARRIDRWQRFENRYCMLYLPIIPRQDMNISIELYETSDSADPIGVASCKFGSPMLFDSSKKWYEIRNDGCHWGSGVRFIFQADYALVLDLIINGKLSNGIEVNLAGGVVL